MAPRAVGAALGLLAFCTAIIAGLWVGNPATVTLARALWAMLAFCLIGLGLGWAARVVVREHIQPNADLEKEIRSTESDAQPMGS